MYLNEFSKLQLSVLLLMTLIRIPASALYFPQSNLTLRIPYQSLNHEQSATGMKIVTLRTLRNDSTVSPDTKYKLSTSSGRIARIDSSTGNIYLHSTPTEVNAITVTAKDKGIDQAVLEITIVPVNVRSKKANCTDHIKDMCFWNISKYRIYENQPVTMLGAIGPDEYYRGICPQLRIARYELLNGTNYFFINDTRLFAKASLDRDAVSLSNGPGPHADIQVQCVVYDKETGLQYAFKNSLSIDILDEDDNSPIPQFNHTVDIHLQNFVVDERLDMNDLLINDADIEASNRYDIRIINDVDDALTITNEVISIEKPDSPHSTTLYIRIYAKKTLLLTSPYQVTLQVKDESMLPGYGANSVNITVTFYGPEHRKISTISPIQHSQPISFPEIIEIHRTVGKYYRVAQPINKPESKMVFGIEGSKVFNITRSGGIVFVSNASLLENELSTTVTLNVNWRDSGQIVSQVILRVSLLNSPLTNNRSCKRDPNAIHTCANAYRQQDCEIKCGVASVGRFNINGEYENTCIWRANKVTRPTEKYATCSPDLAYCPDNTCDELEVLDPRICPQDCAIKSEIHFGEVNPGGRGIKSGLHTCSCDDTVQCICSPSEDVSKDKSIKKNREKNKEVLFVNARKASVIGPCGSSCMIGVIGASLFVLIVIASTFVTWRYRIATKGSQRDCKHRSNVNSNGIEISPSDYVDRGDGLLISLDTFTTTNQHHLLPKACPPDPKWEFPRSQLTIEQVLGEGEFGRVLRAKAIDIGGWPGSTTVAVKTLKESASASELTDLLSEYQLLKEAQHQNVIRLLGACTSPGGPVYLIIEFAEFGSLRNYLRRSRHLESESCMPCSISLLSTSPNRIKDEMYCVDVISDHTITPFDIISFAWQISKGMAYLADIKLVHRDLAARNVLLATGKVCKISDFGLTRDVYEDDAYLKRSKGRVPVKWMAPESLADHVYTSKSDVWSFGVLLWELITLGASPYPGVDVHNLYNLLKAGYRMERPANCSPQLYQLMIFCWHEDPAMRPSFKELTSNWERMLEDGIEYLDLNPRTVHNQAYFAYLHGLDSPTGTKNTDTSHENNLNYLSKPSSDFVTKCDKVDKLETLWQAPSLEKNVNSIYVNERTTNLSMNHYESPIKFRHNNVGCSSENNFETPLNDRPQSYIDMQGKNHHESKDLLVFANPDNNNQDSNLIE